MPITGVYFVPSHPNSTTALPTITERLRSTFTDEDLIPISRWALEHKLMRDTPGLLSTSQRPTKPRYMQFLSLTHYPTHGFIYTSEPSEKPFHPPHAATPTPGAGTSPSPAPASTPIPATPPQPGNAQPTAAADITPMVMTTVPPPSYGTLFQHFNYACQPFWCHRLTVAVPGGVVYDVGDFRVRLGDVRQTFPTGRVRGTAVEIEWRGPSVVESLIPASAGREGGSSSASRVEEDDDSGIDVSFSAVEEADVDAEYAATASLIREFWGRLGVQGAREAILVPGVGKEVKEKLMSWKGQEAKRTGRESFRDEAGFGPWPSGPEEDPDPFAGADLARQYMEVLRFNR